MFIGLKRRLGLLAIPLLVFAIAQPALATPPLGVPAFKAAAYSTMQPEVLTVGMRYCSARVHTNCIVGRSYRQQQNDDAAAAAVILGLGALALSAPYWGGHRHGYGGYYGHRDYYGGGYRGGYYHGGGYRRFHHGW